MLRTFLFHDGGSASTVYLISKLSVYNKVIESYLEVECSNVITRIELNSLNQLVENVELHKKTVAKIEA